MGMCGTSFHHALRKHFLMETQVGQFFPCGKREEGKTVQTGGVYIWTSALTTINNYVYVIIWWRESTQVPLSTMP